MLTCFVALNRLASTYYEYASAHRSIARLASESFVKRSGNEFVCQSYFNFNADRLKRLTCFVRSIVSPQRTKGVPLGSSIHRAIARLACELFIKTWEMIVFEIRLFALELRSSFFEKSFHTFIAVFTGEGLRQEFALESQSVGQ